MLCSCCDRVLTRRGAACLDRLRHPVQAQYNCNTNHRFGDQQICGFCSGTPPPSLSLSLSRSLALSLSLWALGTLHAMLVSGLGPRGGGGGMLVPGCLSGL